MFTTDQGTKIKCNLQSKILQNLKNGELAVPKKNYYQAAILTAMVLVEEQM